MVVLIERNVELFLEYSSSSKKEQSDFTEVPILLRNRVPEGFENDDNLNVSLRPEQVSRESRQSFISSGIMY
jgi:hypothetical protein